VFSIDDFGEFCVTGENQLCSVVYCLIAAGSVCYRIQKFPSRIGISFLGVNWPGKKRLGTMPCNMTASYIRLCGSWYTVMYAKPK